MAAIVPERFTRFAAVDWSGAKGNRHPGIALAVCERGSAAPALIAPSGRHWSRREVLDWLLGQTDDLLIGFDFTFAPPLIERGAYLPGESGVPDSARAFWAYVDRVCDDADLGAASFLETHHRRHFYFGAADGRKADFLHQRRCEHRYNSVGGLKVSTVFDPIGAAQVAKASFAGMRLLHHLDGQVAIWPFDQLPERGPVVVEIYTAIPARAAGMRKGRSKFRDAESLDAALAMFGSDPHIPLARYDDHSTDAILTAAWLRANAANAALWNPPQLDARIARTEGWTFGIP